MASATGIPEVHEPLLGPRGDVDLEREREREKLVHNFITGKLIRLVYESKPGPATNNSFLGTASVAQVGVWMVSDPSAQYRLRI